MFLVLTNWFRVLSWILFYNVNSISRGKYHHIAIIPVTPGPSTIQGQPTQTCDIFLGFLFVKFLILILCRRTLLVYSCFMHFSKLDINIFFKSQNKISLLNFHPQNLIWLKFFFQSLEVKHPDDKSHDDDDHHHQHLHNKQKY